MFCDRRVKRYSVCAPPLLRFGVALLFLINVFSPTLLLAQDITVPESKLPGTMDPNPNYLGTQIDVDGNTTTITGGMRTNEGKNLFHSFLNFSVDSGHTANFLNDPGNPTTNNIFSRVTGGSASTIDGTIKTTNFSDANLYLLNPNGIVFGSTAQLNLGGAFYGTNANYIRFDNDNNTKFGPGLNPDATLLYANPTDFGFMGPAPASAITVNGLTSLNETPIILVGRDANGLDEENKPIVVPGVEISGLILNGEPSNANGSWNTSIEGGIVSIASVGAEGMLPSMAGEAITSSPGEWGFPAGEIKIHNGGRIIVSGNPAGTVFIRGGKLTLNGESARSFIHARNLGKINHAAQGDATKNKPGTAIDIDVVDEFSIINGGQLSANALGIEKIVEMVEGEEQVKYVGGSGGDIVISADKVKLEGRGFGDISSAIATRSFMNNVTYPDVEITPNDTVVKGGNGGKITINTNDLSIKDSTFISTTTRNPIVANTQRNNTGNAGKLEINPITPDSSLISISGTQGIFSESLSSGSPGEISISTGQFTLSQVNITTTNIDGDTSLNEGNISISASRINLLNGAEIEASTSGSGNAGNILLDAESVTSNGGASEASRVKISSSSSSTQPGAGKAGTVTILADRTIVMPDGSMSKIGTISLTNTDITTSVADEGQGGSISIEAAGDNTLTLTNSNLTATVKDFAKAREEDGTIKMDPKGNPLTLMDENNIALDGPTHGLSNISLTSPTIQIFDGTITVETTGDRNAGDILLSTDSLTSTGGLTEAQRVTISSSSTSSAIGSGNSGNVTIQGLGGDGTKATNAITLTRTDIETDARGTGKGGDITINGANAVTLDHTRLKADVNNKTAGEDTEFSGATITIDGTEMKILGGGITAGSTGSRDAGRIDLNVGALTTEEGSQAMEFVGPGLTTFVQITSSSVYDKEGAGDAGSVKIVADKAKTLPEGSTTQPGAISLVRTDIRTAVTPEDQDELKDLSTLNFNSDGQGGTISIEATRFRGEGVDIRSSANGISGDAGSVVFDVETFEVLRGSTIFSETLNPKGSGKAGTVEVQASGAEGTLAKIALTGSRIQTNANGEGQGGEILLTAEDFTSKEGGELKGEIQLNQSNIVATVRDFAKARDEEGNILKDEKGNPLPLTDEKGKLLDWASNPDGLANIEVSASNIMMTQGGIRAETEGDRDAGAIQIKGDAATLNGIVCDKCSSRAEILGSSRGTGKAGTITFQVDKLTTNVDVSIKSESSNIVELDAVTLQILDPNKDAEEKIREARGEGSAGTITIEGVGGNPATKVVLNNTEVSTETKVGTGGEITIRTQDMKLHNSTVNANTVGSGNAGNVTLKVKNLAATSTSPERTEISSSSTGVDVNYDEIINDIPVKIAEKDVTDIFATGNAGNVKIHGVAPPLPNGLSLANKVLLEKTKLITNVGPEGGQGGNISIATNILNLNDGTTIRSDTSGPGHAGGITFNVNTLTANVKTNDAGLPDTELVTQADGKTKIHEPKILADVSKVEISSRSTGPAQKAGNAGFITIQGANNAAASNVALAKANISTNASSTGGGGAISITSAGMKPTEGLAGIYLKGTDISASVTNIPAVGEKPSDFPASIELAANHIRIEDSSNIDGSTRGSRNAGDIKIAVKTYEATDSPITSKSNKPSTDAGAAGRVLIKGVDSDSVAEKITLNRADISTTIEGGDMDTPTADITLQAKTIELGTNTDIRANTHGEGNAGNIQAEVRTFTAFEAKIESNSTSSGSAGSVSIHGTAGPKSGATQITLTGNKEENTGSRIDTSSKGEGPGGEIILKADPKEGKIILERANLVAQVTDFAKARDEEGNILKDEKGNPLPLMDKDGKPLDGPSNKKGLANIEVSASNIMMTQGGIRAETFGDRNAGNITIVASDTTTINGDAEAISSQKAQILGRTFNKGQAGTITFQVDTLQTNVDKDGKPLKYTLLENTPLVEIASTTTSTDFSNTFEGNGGVITIEGVEIEGMEGVEKTPANSVLLYDTELTTETKDGKGGTITVRAQDVALDNSTVNANTVGSGNAGNINLEVNSLTTTGLSRRTEISSSSTGPNTDAAGNPIAPFATGNAGNVVIQGIQDLEQEGIEAVANAISLSQTDIETDARGTGQGGAIDILAASTLTMDNVNLSANVANGPNLSDDPTGNIFVTAGGLALLSDSEMTAKTTGERHAGNIIFFAPEVIAENVQVSSSSTGLDINDEQGVSALPFEGKEDLLATGNAGVVIFSGNDLQFDNSKILTEALGEGGGGLITLDAVSDVTLSNTEVSTSVHNGSAGAQAGILITTPHLDISGGNLRADTTGSRDAGGIFFNVDTLDTHLFGNERVKISTSSTGLDANRDGEVNSVIRNNIGDELASGKAGNIGIFLSSQLDFDTPPTMVTLEDTDIQTEAKGTGQGGFINIVASEQILLTDSSLSVDTNNTPDNPFTNALISLDTPRLEIIRGGIFARTSGNRNAGGIFVHVDDTLVASGVEFSSSSTGLDTNGNEHLDILATGNAGNIFVDGPTLLFDSSKLLTEAKGEGVGGRIALDGLTQITLTGTEISTSVHDGTGGDLAGILVTTPVFNMMGGSLRADTTGSRDAGFIGLLAPEVTTVGASISTSSLNANADGQFDSLATGNAGGIFVEGDNLVFENSELLTEALGEGVGGLIQLDGSSTVRFSNAEVSTTVHDGGSGEQANIVVTTPTLDIVGGSLRADTTGSRNAGAVTLNTNDFSALNTVISSSSSGLLTTGNAGDVIIQGLTGSGSPVLNSFELTTSSVITEAQGLGQGGSIVMASASPMTVVESLVSANVTNGANLSASEIGNIALSAPDMTIIGGSLTAETRGSRGAGNITLRAEGGTISTQSVVVSSQSTGTHTDVGQDGQAGTISLFAGELSLQDTTITTEALGNGAGGSITLEATSPSTLELDHSTISAAVNDAPISGASQGQNALGNISLMSPTIRIMNGSEVSALSQGSRDAGSVNLVSDDIHIAHSMVATSGAGSGAGGDILVDAATQLILDAATLSATVNDGQGGNIDLSAGSNRSTKTEFGKELLLVSNASTITAGSAGVGNAGTISLGSTGTLRVQDHSLISTEAAQATGGQITLQSDFLLHILESDVKSSVGGDVGSDGGNIELRSGDFVVLQGSAIEAKALAGRGGDITVTSPTFLADSFTTLDASSEFGVSGIVNIDSPVQNLSQSLAPLPEDIVEVASLLSEQCAAQKDGEFSSLTLGGRDRIPHEPGELLPTPTLLRGLDGLPPVSSLDAPSPQLARLGLTSLVLTQPLSLPPSSFPLLLTGCGPS